MTSALSNAQDPPAQRYNLPVPEPTGVISSGSNLLATFGDAAGNTLYVLRHTQVFAGPGVSTEPVEVARQWILVNGRGVTLATRTFPSASDFPTDIVSFSRRRILARVDSGNGVFIEAFRPVEGQLVSEGLAVQLDLDTEVGEVVAESPQRPPKRFFDVVVSRGGKVTNIRRFDTARVKPAPQS